MAADGTVVEAARRRRGARGSPRGCGELGIDSVAVCFLHSYLYPEHEQRVGAILAEELPERDRLALERDPARAARVRADGDDGGQRLRAAADVVVHRPDPDRPRRDRAEDAPLAIMQSSGGVMTSDDAKARPVFALESGPGGRRRRRARDGAAARHRER